MSPSLKAKVQKSFIFNQIKSINGLKIDQPFGISISYNNWRVACCLGFGPNCLPSVHSRVNHHITWFLIGYLTQPLSLSRATHWILENVAWTKCCDGITLLCLHESKNCLYSAIGIQSTVRVMMPSGWLDDEHFPVSKPKEGGDMIWLSTNFQVLFLSNLASWSPILHGSMPLRLILFKPSFLTAQLSQVSLCGSRITLP